MVSEKKIALIGLDNAGKTSILTVMKQKFDIPNTVKGLKPTLKVERSSFLFMGHEIAQWDFGGQKKYRDEYLRYKERYLGGIDLLFYVIDVQDNLRFDESMEYLQAIADYLKTIEEKIPIVILFHKVDPKLKEDPTIRENIKLLKEKISKILDNIKYDTFETNIFEIMLVIRAFSRGIASLYTQTQAIERFMLDIVEKMENVMALLLFDQNGIELGSYFLEHITLQMQKKILTLYEIAQRRIIESNQNIYEFSDRLDAFTKVSGVIQEFEIDGWRFYILLVLEEHSEEVVIDQLNFFEQSYAEMLEILQSILEDDPRKQAALNPQ